VLIYLAALRDAQLIIILTSNREFLSLFTHFVLSCCRPQRWKEWNIMNNSLLAEIDITFLSVFICGQARGVLCSGCGRAVSSCKARSGSRNCTAERTVYGESKTRLRLSNLTGHPVKFRFCYAVSTCTIVTKPYMYLVKP
jgi:hypothetical protein